MSFSPQSDSLDRVPCSCIVGGADAIEPAADALIRPFFERGVAPAVEATGAIIVDGGTSSGVMAVAGETLGTSGVPVVLVGVAPAGRVTYPGGQRAEAAGSTTALEANHSHFILASSDHWGGETGLLFEVIEALAGSSRVVVLVAGGGAVTGGELLEGTARGWPIVVIAGTGGLAGSLAYRR